MNWYKRAQNQARLDMDYPAELQMAENSIRILEKDVQWYQSELIRLQDELKNLQTSPSATPAPGAPNPAAQQQAVNEKITNTNQQLAQANERLNQERQGLQLLQSSYAQNQQRMGNPYQKQPNVRWQNMTNPQMWSNPFAAMQARMQQRSQGY